MSVKVGTILLGKVNNYAGHPKNRLNLKKNISFLHLKISWKIRNKMQSRIEEQCFDHPETLKE